MEVWKDIPGYEGLYQASSEGRIRGLSRKRRHGVFYKGFMLTNTGRSGLYRNNSLTDAKGIKKTFTTHRLVYISFNGPVCDGLVIDHINANKTDNRLSNLRAITQRENSQYGKERTKKSPTPVGLVAEGNRYAVHCAFGRRNYRIGSFKTEKEAKVAYQYAIDFGIKNAREKYLNKPKFSVRGVSFCNTRKKFRAYYSAKKGFKTLGYFDDVNDAIKARSDFDISNAVRS